MRSLWILLLAVSSLSNAEDALDGTILQQGPCFRVRIDQGNDDDGNAYFYNGAYRSQYRRYISFSVCNQNGGDACTEYVTELETYLAESVGYMQKYCDSCLAQCRRRLRRLEDEQQEEEEGDWEVDCSECSSECAPIFQDDGSARDESQYLDCEQAVAGSDDGDDVDYYVAPQCENGEVVIGHFYDDECTIKTSTLQDGEFSYTMFRAMETTPIRCDLSNDSCNNLFGNDAVSCGDDMEADGDGGGEDNEHLCKAAKAASRVYTFYKKPVYKKLHLGALALLLVVATSSVGFLAYTYFVRHNRTHKTPMSEQGIGGEPAAATSADLPPMS